MKSKWAFLVLIVMCFIVTVKTVSQEIQIIYTTTESALSNDLHKSEFIDQLREILEDINYELVYNSSEAENNLEIEFSITEEDKYLISLRPLTPVNSLQSSIIYSQLGQSFDYEINNWQQDIEGLLKLTTGLSLYSVEEYRLALNYLSMAEDNIIIRESEIVSTSNQIMFLKFYIGNCYLELSEYEQATNTYFHSILGINYFPLYINHLWGLLQLDRNWTSHYGVTRDEYITINMSFIQPSIQSVDLTTGNIVDILSRTAKLYALTFDYDSAIVDIDEAINLAEANELDNAVLAELYTVRGEIIFLIYEWDRVEDNFDTAIELDADYAPAYFQRGVLFYTMARREDALTDFEQYLVLEPDGIFAEQADGYIESIQVELDALGG